MENVEKRETKKKTFKEIVKENKGKIATGAIVVIGVAAGIVICLQNEKIKECEFEIDSLHKKDEEQQELIETLNSAAHIAVDEAIARKERRVKWVTTRVENLEKSNVDVGNESIVIYKEELKNEAETLKGLKDVKSLLPER